MATMQAALGRMTGNGATALRDAVHLAATATAGSDPAAHAGVHEDDTASWLTEDAVP
jgi:hypothetical protein